ncbi:MAG: hypothetical protein AAF845_09590 [Bacteroidota bacterium]
MAARKPSSPFDDVRKAFSDLDTSEKAAFVFEATFATLGQALDETGQRVAEAIDDLDIESWFRPSTSKDADPEPKAKPRASRSKTSGAKPKTPASKPKTSRSKTTRKKPPSDDA